MRMLYSILFWTFLVLSSALLFPIALLIWLVTLPFDRRKVILHRFTCFWGSLYTWLNPAWPVRLVGGEKLGHEPTVLVANHLSLLDILVLFRLQSHFKWVSKIENFRIPFIGWNMVLNEYIPLKRGDRTSVVQMMRLCERALGAGNSVMMFPEGTRSPSGRMRRFKTGAFELALKSNAPVQPIVLQGTHDALPKRGFVLRGRHPISIRILDPVSPDLYEGMSAEDLTNHVRELIASHLGDDAVEDSKAPAVQKQSGEA